jgi:hypothetical protein
MSRTSSTLTKLFGAGLLLASLTPSAGCSWLFGGYDGVFLEAEDVSLDIPSTGFRADAQGDLWWLITTTASETNGWVTSVVETTGYIVEFLNNHRESGLDGEWRVYGPFDDNSGRDVTWLVRITGSDLDTSFEFLIAPLGTSKEDEFELMASGSLTVEDELRFGNVDIDFDVIEHYPQLDWAALWDFSGGINIEFERHVDSGEKTITLQYDNFVANRTGYLDDDRFESNETYAYHKAADGSGSFHLALMGEWDTWPYTWSGPQQERMQLDMQWLPDGTGRAFGSITQVDGVGDMKHGDLSLDECFDASGCVSYRLLTEAYASEVPGGYNLGTPDTCALELP